MRRRIAKNKHCPKTGKIRYRDEKSAQLVVNRAKPRDGRPVPVRVYWCGQCGGWHTTSQELRS